MALEEKVVQALSKMSLHCTQLLAFCPQSERPQVLPASVVHILQSIVKVARSSLLELLVGVSTP